MRAAAVRQPADARLGVLLERDRLTVRAARMDRVARALRARAADSERRGSVPEPLRQSIAGFRREIALQRRRLGSMDRAAVPVRERR